eukprot:scaffold39838_cov70-Phaeocystis_antarctica.AAC.18
MKPTLPKRLRRPFISARETVVLPTCCRTAATKSGRAIVPAAVLSSALSRRSAAVDRPLSDLSGVAQTKSMLGMTAAGRSAMKLFEPQGRTGPQAANSVASPRGKYIDWHCKAAQPCGLLPPVALPVLDNAADKLMDEDEDAIPSLQHSRRRLMGGPMARVKGVALVGAAAQQRHRRRPSHPVHGGGEPNAALASVHERGKADQRYRRECGSNRIALHRKEVDVAIFHAVAVDAEQLKGRPLVQVSRARHLHEALARECRIGTCIKPSPPAEFDGRKAAVELTRQPTVRCGVE